MIAVHVRWKNEMANDSLFIFYDAATVRAFCRAASKAQGVKMVFAVDATGAEMPG